MTDKKNKPPPIPLSFYYESRDSTFFINVVADITSNKSVIQRSFQVLDENRVLQILEVKIVGIPQNRTTVLVFLGNMNELRLGDY